MQKRQIMIESRAIVVKIEKNQVWVESNQTSSCGQCSQQQQCSTRVLDNFSQKQIFAITTELDLKVGETVQISIAENHLLGAAAILYFMPLCALFIGAGIAAFFSGQDLIISGAALSCFLVSLRLIKALQQQYLSQNHCQPLITKKDCTIKY